MKIKKLMIFFMLFVSMHLLAQGSNKAVRVDCTKGTIWITGKFEKYIKNGSSSSSKTTTVTINHNGKAITKEVTPTLLMQKLGFSIPVTCKGGTISIRSSGPEINVTQSNSNPERTYKVYDFLFD